MLVISRIGNNHTPIQSQNTDTHMGFEAIVLFVLVRHCWGNVLGSLIQAFIALLGTTRLAVFCILFHLRPEAFVGCSNLTRNRACHLRGQTKAGTDLVIRSVLQRDCIAHFPVLVSILAHKVKSISICQLGRTESCKLLWCRIQFDFCRNHRFHAFHYSKFSTECQKMKADDNPKVPPMPLPQKRKACFLPMDTSGGFRRPTLVTLWGVC